MPSCPFRIIALSLLLLGCLPNVTHAAKKRLDLYNPRKHYKDEKVTINNPTSRCITAEFQRVHQNALAQAHKDFAAKGGEAGGKVLVDAFDDYQKEIVMAWDAMQEPYCGFGAFGSSAAKKSFQKTLSRVRADFLASTRSLASKEEEATSAVSVQVPVKPAEVARASVSSHLALQTNLKRGMRTQEVKTLQDWLVVHQYLNADYATGYFGQMTEKGVMKFQLEKGLIVSATSEGAGLVGPRTRAAFMK